MLTITKQQVILYFSLLSFLAYYGYNKYQGTGPFRQHITPFDENGHFDEIVFNDAINTNTPLWIVVTNNVSCASKIYTSQYLTKNYPFITFDCHDLDCNWIKVDFL